MGLIVVATFMSLPEALVAASALESGDLHPFVMDQGWGAMIWTQQFALQGFRLAVPAAEVDDAIAYFRSVPRRRVHSRPRPRNIGGWIGANWWRPTAVVLGFGYSFSLGWLIISLSRQRRHGHLTQRLTGALVCAAIILPALCLLLFLNIFASKLAGILVLAPLVAAVAISVASDRSKARNLE